MNFLLMCFDVIELCVVVLRKLKFKVGLFIVCVCVGGLWVCVLLLCKW